MPCMEFESSRKGNPAGPGNPAGQYISRTEIGDSLDAALACHAGGCRAMSPDDVDLLLSELSASLSPPQYSAFIAAARAALEGITCLGPGAAYRALAPLQKFYFDPPPDARHANLGARHHRASKLAAAPPIGAEDPRATGRARAQWARR